MYYISEANNSKGMDKALVRRGDKRSIFDHRILTTQEVYKSNKAAMRFRRNESKDASKNEIWKNFTIPINNKIKERST